MDKPQIIAFIEDQLAQGKISKEDLTGLAVVSVPEQNSKNLINTFYGIGAIIAIIGVGILVSQNWTEIGFIGRMLVSVGISLASYVIGLLIRNPEQKMLSQVMFTLSASLAPLGSYVFLKEAGIDFSSSTQLATAVILLIIFGTALFISRRNILVLITAGFASWAYFALITRVFEFDYYDTDFYKWFTMLLGASYICIGYGYKTLSQPIDLQDSKEKKAIQDIFYGLGTLALLGAGIFIGGIFDLFLIVLIFGAFYGSVYLKSKSMLTLGSFFLMAHIIKLTSEYFVDSLGWPVTLIGIGFLVIGIGYATFYLNKRFISAK